MKNIIGYLGSKNNLSDFLTDIIITPNEKNKKLFIDVFAGTCSVGKLIQNKTNWDIVSNDISYYSNVLGSQLRLNEIGTREMYQLRDTLLYLDSLSLIEGDFYHEFSMGGTPKTIKNKKIFSIKKNKKDDKGNEEIYFENNQEFKNSRMFFKGEVGKKIDTVRSKIKELYENEKISKDFKDLLLLFLLNYVNKNSNYTGVYGAYLKHDKFKKRGIVEFFDVHLYDYIYQRYLVMREKSNKTITKKLFADKLLKELNFSKYSKEDIIIYMDPPYSTRSYEGNYHILDYICNFDFNISDIKEDSKSATKKKKEKNPFNSKKETFDIFEKLIKGGLKKSNNIYISYSNEGLMKEEEIYAIISSIKGAKIKTYQQEYKRYTSGENKGENTGKKKKVYELVWHIWRDNES